MAKAVKARSLVMLSASGEVSWPRRLPISEVISHTSIRSTSSSVTSSARRS
jgi:hypothetical protein